MQGRIIAGVTQVRIGLLLAMLTIGYGFVLGGIFGIYEDDIIAHLKSRASQVLGTVYKGDEARMQKVADKSWVYFKRAHMHGSAIGTTAIVLILLISLLSVNKLLKAVTALLLGLGGLGYSIFWLLAGFKAPALGGTTAAKEALAWLAMPTLGMCLIGLALVLMVVARLLISPQADADK